jgi:hypothetical protein
LGVAGLALNAMPNSLTGIRISAATPSDFISRKIKVLGEGCALSVFSTTSVKNIRYKSLVFIFKDKKICRKSVTYGKI